MKAAAPERARDLARYLAAEHFSIANDELVVGGVGVRSLIARYGSPLYVYDEEILRSQYRALVAAVEGFAAVFYSVKANPNPHVARVFAQLGAGLEIASGAEYLLARAAGCAPERIFFAGPGKGEEELELAIAQGIGEVHLETFEEIELVAVLAERLDCRVPVAIRVNPGAGAQGGAMRMGGKPSAFGFDEEILDDVVAAVARFPRLTLGGIHLFSGTQILDVGTLLTQWRYGLDLAAALADRLGRSLDRIDLGGGLGIPYHPGDGSLDMGALAAGVRPLIAQVRSDSRLSASQILIEPGRYLAGPAGVYLMTVRAVKMSRGQRFIVTDGGMHHHLAASGNLGQVIKRDYPLLAATRMTAPTSGNTSVVGPLCTPLDTLGRQTGMPALEAGDVVAVLQSGAYGLSSSPVGFLGHPMPAEVMVCRGQDRLIRPRGRLDAPLVNPVAIRPIL